MKIQLILTIGLSIVFCGFGSAIVCSQNKSILVLADQYSSALRKFQTQKKRASVEGVLRKGKAVAEKLDELESLNEADYSLIEKKMKGFVVNREEIVFVEPDSRFFIQLSKSRGIKADTAFFSLLHAINPNDVWPAYMEQQTDCCGCTIYGNGLLTKLYGRALQFKKTYPSAFVVDIDKEISDILEAFSESSCACGKIDSVLKEFRLFIKTFPKDKNTPEIKKNLRDIVKRGDFRINCKSG